MHIPTTRMKAALHLIKARALATKVVQESILPTWEFGPWPLTAMVADRAAFDAQEVVVADLDSDESDARGEKDAASDQLHASTKIGVAGGKAQFQGDPGNAARFAKLLAGEDDLAGRLDEALELITAWENSDPLWKPTTALTLTAFKAEYAALKAKRDALKKAESDATAGHGTLNKLANGLWEHCVDWYRVATTVFDAGTPIGDQIRTEIPTSPEQIPPPKAVISVATSPAPGAVHLEYRCDHATKFTVYQKAPGAADFTIVADQVQVKIYDATALAAGSYQYKVIGANAKGDGPESDVKTVAVA